MKKRFFLIFRILVILISVYIVQCLLGIDAFESYSLSKSIYGKAIKPLAFASENNLPVEHIDLIKEYVTENIIRVSANQASGQINRNVFGNNILGFKQHLDYGAGIWDGKWEEPMPDVVALAQGIGIASVRFPGGCGTHHYDWKDTIGKKRKHYWFGLDEFLKVVEILKAEPVITVSYFTGGPEDAADMVEYLNAPISDAMRKELLGGSEEKGVGKRELREKRYKQNFNKYVKNNDGSLNWANYRAINGHPEPYGVTYFEIGNEIYHGDHQDINRVIAETYAQRYLDYYQQMKAVDPTVAIGAVFHTPLWNKTVAEGIQDKIDFGIIHTYPTPAWGKALATWKPKDIFRYVLASPMIKEQRQIQDLLDLLKVHTGRDLPLSVTEFNGGFVQEKPVPYRHTLGNALLNAELLSVFLKPENHILMAQHWNFVNEYWGMIANGFNGKYETLNVPYYKRPNYYVYELYHNHFGELLIESDITSDGYSLWKDPLFAKLVEGSLRRKGGRFGDNVLSGAWRMRHFPGVEAKEADGVLSVDFNEPKKFNYYHSNKNTSVEPNTYYLLSGYIKTENMIDDQGVCLEAQDARGWNQTHSAACTTKVTGTTDWQYVDALYRTLPDARSVNIIARRVGETGPLRGKAMFKDVQLQSWTPTDDLIVPYLSVNASKSEDGYKAYLMVINKNLDEPMTATIELKDFVPAAKANAWVLNGPSVDATNEKKRDNVKITYREFEVWSEEEGVTNSFESPLSHIR